MNLQDWLKNTPEVFPELFDNKTPFQNPLIQDSQEATSQAALEVMQFLLDMGRLWTDDKTFALSKVSARGYINILSCATSALDFEQRYRPEGGESAEDIEDAKQEDVL